MRLVKTAIHGCFELLPTVRGDFRGVFIKTFQKTVYRDSGLRTDFVEDFYSISNAGVLRGLHFQTPPYDHAKVVYCLSGKAFDVVLDLRVGSPSYGAHQVFHLTDEVARMVYIPSGVAHGFLALSNKTILIYKTTSEYSPTHDAGVRWDSMGIQWPIANPTVSIRDGAFQKFNEFLSPFKFSE